LKIISLLAAIVQDELPFHINKIESNDVLYKGDPAYQQEVQDVIDSLIKLILENLSELEKSCDASAKKLRAKLALDLFHHTITYSQLNVNSCALAAKAFKIAQTHKDTAAAAANCLRFLSCLPTPEEEEEGQENMIEQLRAACS